MEWPLPRWIVGFILEYRHRKETTQKPDFLALPMVFHQNADAVGLGSARLRGIHHKRTG